MRGIGPQLPIAGLLSLILFTFSQEAMASDTHSLTVFYPSGVIGSPVVGTYTYSTSDVVTYNFSATNGYRKPIVVVDGIARPTSGAISMNADHYVWAYASPRSGTKLSNVVTVPTDVALIPYPTFYAAQPTTTVKARDPYCTTSTDVISYPASYLGAFPLPEIRGAPLPSSIRRGVGLKDFWQGWMSNPTGILYPPQGPNGWLRPFRREKRSCNIEDGLLKSSQTSIERIKRLGADHVNLYPAFGLIEGNNPAAGINASPSGGGYPQEDLVKLIGMANAQGLKTWIPQWQFINSNDGIAPPAKPSREWISQFFVSYRKFIVEQAQFAEANGVEVFDICAGFGVSGGIDWSLGEDVFASNIVQISQQVRAVYSGKIGFGTWNLGILETLLKNSTFRSNIDLMYIEPYGSVPKEEYASQVNVDAVKLSLDSFYSGYASYLNSRGIDPTTLPPVMFVVQENSFYSALEADHPFVDDGAGCTPDGGDNCLQNDVRIDFSVQAIYNEAVLEFLSTQSYLPVYSIDPKFYWYTDTILPVPCKNLKAVCGFFPNLSTSIRGKPSESIFYQWFRNP